MLVAGAIVIRSMTASSHGRVFWSSAANSAHVADVFGPTLL
jgi:hypothetical protein